MVGKLLLRGMLAGILAAVLAFGFARVFGEPQVDSAIAFESQHHHDHEGADDEPEIVSRSTQAGLGLLTGLVAYGAAIGGILALVFAAANGRLGLGPIETALAVAALGFVAIVLVPALKYPANPPSIGDPATIGIRTASFFTMLLASLVAIVAATMAGRSVAGRCGRWRGVLVGLALFIVATGVAAAFLPSFDEVPEGFSASLLWRFRLSSLGLHAVLWTVLAGGFAWLVMPTRNLRRL
jgi:hypothetical protein